jgi:hypothetical protein
VLFVKKVKENSDILVLLGISDSSFICPLIIKMIGILEIE